MEEYLPLIIQLVSGAVGGNVAGKLMKNLSLGTLWNSVSGILGGGLGGWLLGMIGIDAGGGAVQDNQMMPVIRQRGADRAVDIYRRTGPRASGGGGIA